MSGERCCLQQGLLLRPAPFGGLVCACAVRCMCDAPGGPSQRMPSTSCRFLCGRESICCRQAHAPLRVSSTYKGMHLLPESRNSNKVVDGDASRWRGRLVLPRFVDKPCSQTHFHWPFCRTGPAPDRSQGVLLRCCPPRACQARLDDSGAASDLIANSGLAHQASCASRMRRSLAPSIKRQRAAGDENSQPGPLQASQAYPTTCSTGITLGGFLGQASGDSAAAGSSTASQQQGGGTQALGPPLKPMIQQFKVCAHASCCILRSRSYPARRVALRALSQLRPAPCPPRRPRCGCSARWARAATPAAAARWA